MYYVDDLSNSMYQKMYHLAHEVKERAYAPYSNSKVGCCLLCGNNVYTGVCIENRHKELNCCAERVAVYKAITQGETELLAIAIASSEEVTLPCIKCLNVMEEFAPSIKVIARINEDLRVYRISQAKRLLGIMKRAFAKKS